MSGGAQQDAHELFLQLLDELPQSAKLFPALHGTWLMLR